MIVTPDRRVRVFVSSTLDLIEERAAVKRSILALNLAPVMFEAGARPHPPRSLYSAYVEQSDVFVAVYSTRYGWIAPGMDVSGLEDEFNLSAGKPRLVYIRTDVAREPDLDAFLGTVSEGGLSYRRYSSAVELEALVKDDLVVLLTERFHASTDHRAEVAAGPVAPVPVPPTALVGRTAEVGVIARLLARDDVRLVTLVGPGGIGKTRLAIETARRRAADFPAGIFYVKLGGLREPDLVGDEIAAALKVATTDCCPAVTTVANFLGDRQALLVLDNFEQVISGAPMVAELLSACRGLKVMVTSRAALRLRGEREVQVSPLGVPAGAVPGPDWVGYPALQLFIEAARAVRPSFELDERSAGTVAEICRLLDGLPLAIELAAALMRLLTPEMILARLRDRRTDLAAGRRDMPERHQRLSETIAWSYELLDEPARAAFAQTSAFRAAFTLDSAERVCDVDGEVFDAIASLTEQSLLQARVEAVPATRFSMLQTVREFAGERLAASGQRDRVLSRHAQTFVGLAESVGQLGGRATTVLDAVEAEIDDIRAAFDWLLANRRADVVAQTLWASWWFWWTRGYLREGKLWADRCLEPTLAGPPRAHGLAARAMFAVWSGEYELAVPAFVEAQGIAREGGDTHTGAYADVALGLVRSFTASVGEGTAMIRRAIAAFEALGDEAGATTGVTALTWVQAITREFADDEWVFRQAVERVRAVGSELESGIAEAALAQFHLSRGEVDAASEVIGSSLHHLAGARHIGATILTLEIIAELGVAGDAVGASVTLLGATAAVRSEMGTRVPAQASDRLARLMEAGRDRLGEKFADAFNQGSTMSFAEAVEHGWSVLVKLKAGGAPGS